MEAELRFEVASSSELGPGAYARLIGLCNRAYGEDLESLFATFEGGVHVLAFLGRELAAHAMWVTRWLQPGDNFVLRSAYVEMVATAPEYQDRGFGGAVMQRLEQEIGDYDLGALCPADTSLYTYLGWELWRGPLFIRTPAGLTPTPTERVMIKRLSKTPPLDLDASLSAEWRKGELW